MNDYCERCLQPMNDDNPCANDDEMSCQDCYEGSIEKAMEQYETN